MRARAPGRSASGSVPEVQLPSVPARSSGAVVPAGREGHAWICSRGGGRCARARRQRSRTVDCLGSLGKEEASKRRRVVPGASGVLQRPNRGGGVMHVVDGCVVGALGAQQTHLLLHLRVLALIFISCDLKELISYK